jgi:branched-chain amino acid transport system substrate-binding protein
MKKKLGIIAVVIIAILIIVGVSAQQKSGTDTIRVGVILPLSGQYASLGETDRNGILLAQKDLGEDSRVEFIFEDDKYDAKTALSAYRKLRDLDKVDAIISLGAPTIEAIQPVVTKEDVLTLQLGSELAHYDDPIFQLMPAGEAIYIRLGQEASKRYEKVAVVYQNATLFTLNAQYFKEGLAQTTQVTDYKLDATSDYRTEVQKILRDKPDALTVFLAVESGIKFLRELQNQSGAQRLAIICDGNIEITLNQYKEALGTEVFEGCISTALPNTMTPEFTQKYKAAYTTDPLFTADYAYDAALILNNLAGINKNKWTDTLRNEFTYSGASGDIQFDDKGTRTGEAEVKIFKNGAFVPL